MRIRKAPAGKLDRPRDLYRRLQLAAVPLPLRMPSPARYASR